MTDLGNAVNAKWVGPSGHQLWDGTILNPGDIVLSIGKDEAEGSPYWEVVDKLPKSATPVSEVSANRFDPDQSAALEAAPAVAELPAPTPDPEPTAPAASKGADS